MTFILITLCHFIDDHALSTHRILMESTALGPQAETIARKIFEKYYPIEQSATLTKKRKTYFHDLVVDRNT